MGGGGLSFLNKKPWHPGSLKNIEQVWIAEQKEEENKKRVEELQKQIREEKVIEELKRQQVKAGIITKTEAEKLEWMYNAPITGGTSEEKLLGAPIKDSGKDIKAIKATSNVVSSKFEKIEKNKLAQYIEKENKMREDPLTFIRKKMRSERNAILTNPVKMKKIYQEAKILKKFNKYSKLDKLDKIIKSIDKKEKKREIKYENKSNKNNKTPNRENKYIAKRKRNKKMLSKKEMKSKLEQMMKDGSAHQISSKRKLENHKLKSEYEKKKNKQDQKDVSDLLNRPSFLKKTDGEAFLGTVDNIEKRLRKRKFYRQKNANCDNFIKR